MKIVTTKSDLKPHILVTVSFTGTAIEKEIRCHGLLMDADEFGLYDEEGLPLFFSSRSICEITSINRVQ